MSFFKTLLGTATGFLTGGPVGAAAGLLGSLGGSNAPTASYGGAAPVAGSRLNDYLSRQAFMRGLQEGLTQKPPESFDPWAALGVPRGTRQRSNQAGGQG